jgi:tetratricopeptide (TPR) repeat protein
MATADELYNAADTLKEAGKYTEAIARLNEGVAQDPQHVLSHLALAVLYGKVNQHDLAVQHGEQAIQLEPNAPFNFTALSVTYQRAYAGTNNQRYIQLAEDAKARAHMLAGHHH